MENERKECVIEVTSLPTSKAIFRGIYEEAESMAEGTEGRSVMLSATSTTGKPMIYAQIDGKNIGLVQNPSQIEEAFEIISSGNFSSHLCGAGEGGRVLVKVRESDTPAKAQDESSKGDTIEKDIVSKGLLTQDGLDERIKYLKSIGVKKGDSDYALILRAIKPGNAPKPDTMYKVVGGKKADNPIHEMLTSIALGENVILEGPKSVGKNVMFETAAWLLNCRIVLMQCNGRMTKAEMFGFEATDNSAKNALSASGLEAFFGVLKGNLQNAEGVDFALNLAKSMSPTLAMENGSILEALEIAEKGQGVILVLDEMNLADPNTLSGAINDIADGHTPDIFVAGKGKVKINRDCFILGATQNGTGGDFIGTRNQNDATMSRFSCIKMETPNSIISLLRQMNIDGLEDSVYDTFDRVYKNYKDGVESGTYPMSCLNIRGFKAALRRIAVGRDIKQSISICVNNTVPHADDTALLDAALDDIIS